jgi:hypothetical protein
MYLPIFIRERAERGKEEIELKDYINFEKKEEVKIKELDDDLK